MNYTSHKHLLKRKQLLYHIESKRGVIWRILCLLNNLKLWITCRGSDARQQFVLWSFLLDADETIHVLLRYFHQEEGLRTRGGGGLSAVSFHLQLHVKFFCITCSIIHRKEETVCPHVLIIFHCNLRVGVIRHVDPRQGEVSSFTVFQFI